MKIAIAQVNSNPGKFSQTVEHMLSSARQALVAQADLVVFPATVMSGAYPQGLVEHRAYQLDLIDALYDLAARTPVACVVPAYMLDSQDAYTEFFLCDAGDVCPLRRREAYTSVIEYDGVSSAPVTLSWGGVDLLFVAGFRLGTAGAAIATSLSQLICAGLVVWTLARIPGACRLQLSELRFDRALLGRMTAIGLPAGLASVMYSAANVIIQKAINLLGTDAAAAWSIFWKLDGIYWPVSNAIGITVMTFTGQNYGARQPDRIRKIIRTGLGMHLGFSALFSLTLFLTRYLTVRCFTDDPAVIAEGVTIICMLAFFYPVFCCVEVFSSAMRGCGNSVMPTVLTLFGTCLLRLALLYTVTFPHLSNWTIAICYPATWGTTSLLFLIYYRFFRWMPGQKPQT